MRILLAILSGFCVAVIVFASGVATTVALLTDAPEPVRSPDTNTAEPWTNEPVRVDAATQDFVRLPPRAEPERSDMKAQAQAPSDGRDTADNGEQIIDPMTTAGVSKEPTPQPVPRLNAAHVEWCSQRYRSYDPRDNRYNAYSGERRECTSPYSETMAGSEYTETMAGSEYPEEEESAVSASTQGYPASSTYLDSEHAQSCFERYASYRPEDNTYQPYGGGPRRPCL